MLRTYDLTAVDQYQATGDPDLIPTDPDSAFHLSWAVGFEATLYGLPSALQYAQMCEQTRVLPDGSWAGLNEFTHQPDIAGPEFAAFRVPNVDTLYSNAWLYLPDSGVHLTLPDCGPRYFTLNLLDAHGNATNISSRTHGRGPHRILLVGSEWDGEAPSGSSLFRVATPIMWGLLRIQVLGAEDLDAVRSLQRQVHLAADAGAGSAAASWPRVTADAVESDWESYFTAVDTVLRVCGVPVEEWAHVRRFQAIGVGGESPFDSAALPEAIRRGVQVGFTEAFEVLRSSRSQLGVSDGGGWTRVANKGRHGTNYTARAIMNHVGLGANVVEENTSFNTYRDVAGEQLDGRTGRYELTFSSTPPVSFFWSVTLYVAGTGRVSANTLSRYSIGGSGSETRDGVRLSIQCAPPHDPADLESWLPAPPAEFFLVLRAYGPKQELLDGTWVPDGVRRTGDGSAPGTEAPG
jgi:hypothetical protein